MTFPNRRSFLSTSTSTAAAIGVAASTAKSYGRVIGANDRLGVGVIGGGVIGNAHFDVINKLKESNNLLPVAVSDCWMTRAEAGKQKIGADAAYNEYKRLLDRKEVDYVVVATPEHWHWTMTIDAMDAGKAVYCEKPLTHTIPEAQAVVKKQKETGRPLQAESKRCRTIATSPREMRSEKESSGKSSKHKSNTSVDTIRKKAHGENPNSLHKMQKSQPTWIGMHG